jgi:hypothetical protein
LSIQKPGKPKTGKPVTVRKKVKTEGKKVPGEKAAKINFEHD